MNTICMLALGMQLAIIKMDKQYNEKMKQVKREWREQTLTRPAQIRAGFTKKVALEKNERRNVTSSAT